ncbi:hypothetical protein BDN70DRAFT_897245 [Pholiota conissans]|uniref:Uncharacterized protein n=1 Tax=Pholiota conissans TaxID=109636 RepID=A0A9P5YXN4_9AGAR|nr:hypothetical protein BDN70DRAFT_897245 [Pholiota conissans]
MTAFLQIPALPYDLQLEIVKAFLNQITDTQDRTNALNNLSLVSPALRDFCQKQIFRRFTIGKSAYHNQKLLFLLWHIPRLRSYCKELRYEVPPSAPARHVSEAEIRLIQGLESLEHISVTVMHGDFPYEDLAICVRQTINYVIASFPIISLCFEGVTEIDPNDFALWGSLTSVEIRSTNPNPTFSRYDSEDVDPGGAEDICEDFDQLQLVEHVPEMLPQQCARIKLRNLSLLDADDVLYSFLSYSDEMFDVKHVALSLNPSDWYLCYPEGQCSDDHHIPPWTPRIYHPTPLRTSYAFDFSQLRTFTVDFGPSNLRLVWHIIRQASESLVSLDIRERLRLYSTKDAFGLDLKGPFIPRDFPQEISLASLSALRVLSFKSNIKYNKKPHELASWCPLLRTAPNGLRELNFTIDLFEVPQMLYIEQIFILPDTVDKNGNPLPNKFDALDELISSRYYFPSLETFRIHVVLPEPDDCLGEYGFDYDVVNEDDLKERDIFCALEPASTVANNNPSSSAYINELDGPAFVDDDDWDVTAPLVHSNYVRASIDYIFRRTKARFSSTDSFIVTIDVEPFFNK